MFLNGIFQSEVFIDVIGFFQILFLVMAKDFLEFFCFSNFMLPLYVESDGNIENFSGAYFSS